MAEHEIAPIEEDAGGCSPPLLLVIVAVMALMLAVVVGRDVFTALYGLVFPPEPPLPPNVTQVGHDNRAHGVDDWRYATALNPCELVAFYEDNNSTCTVMDGLCLSDGYAELGYTLPGVATCIGTDTFGVFGLRWQVSVDIDWSREGETYLFDITRDTLWSGPAPAATSTPPPATPAD